MIIVEGPDGAGKTSLITRLAAETSIPVHERAVRDKTGPDERDLWEWTHVDMANWGEQVYLYDRHPLVSEYIYGPLTRGQVAPGFDRQSAHALRQRLEQQCLLILCLPPLAEYHKNLLADEQMEGVLDHQEALYGLYSSLTTTWGGWLKRYDYTDPTAYHRVSIAARVHAAQWRKTR
jgi:hypothetical protein